MPLSLWKNKKNDIFQVDHLIPEDAEFWMEAADKLAMMENGRKSAELLTTYC